MSSLSVFSYGFTTDGELVRPDGNFNNFLISAVVNDQAAKENLLANLFRIPFADFVADVRDYLSVRLSCLGGAGSQNFRHAQVELLYEGKDYGLLGEAADSVLLMTYEWGYTYGPPMAVAPID